MEHLQQYAVALDKWRLLIVSHKLVILGFLGNTRSMTIGVTDKFRREVAYCLKYTWHDVRGGFTVKEMENLVGKLGRIGQAYRPIYYIMPHLYASVAYAL